MEEPGLRHPPHDGDRLIGGAPVHLIRKAARSAAALAWHTVQGHMATAFEYELWLRFFAGIVRQRWPDRHQPIADGPATVRAFAQREHQRTVLSEDGVDLFT